MQYNCGDIMFDFFFRGDYAITWSITQGDLRFSLSSVEERDSDLALDVATVIDSANDCTMDVVSSIESYADTAYDIVAVSWASISLCMEQQGWSDNVLSLIITSENTSWDHQILLNVREEDWFTN